MASDEQFSLCWNNFHANMSAGFHGLLSRGDLVDVTLAAEGRLLQAHKLVLSVCSPYFQEMFKMNPTQHPIVFLKDVSHSALRDLLQFMYQGEVNVKQEELASFISTAEQLQVKGLTGNQNEENSTPSKPKPTSRPGPRSSQQRQSVMTKIETDLDSKPSSTPVAVKRPNRPSIASNNSSSSQSGPAKRKCVDPLEAGPSGSAKEEFVTIPDEDENNAVAPKMEPEFVNESMWDDDEDGTNNDETNFGEDDSNMDMTGFDGSATGDGNITGGGEGGAVGDAQDSSTRVHPVTFLESQKGKRNLWRDGYPHTMLLEKGGVSSWRCRNRKCKGFIKIDEVNKTILRARPHVESCKPDFALFQRQKILSVVKHFVANADPSIPIKKIYDNYVNAYLALNPNCENDLPKYDQIKDTLRRKRKHLIPPTVSGIKNVNVSYVEESPNLMFSDVSQKETDDREPDRDLPNYLGLPYGGTDHGKQEQAVPTHEGLKQETPDNVEKKNEGLLQGMLVHENQNPAVSGISRPDHENLKIRVRAGLGFGGPHHGSLVRTGSGFRGPDHGTPNHAKADREIPVQEEPDIGP